MKVNEVTSYVVEGRVAVITVDSPPVNALSAVVRTGIAGAIGSAEADDDVGAVVLICDGRTFFAGADISEIGKPLAEPSIRTLESILENATKPVVAAIHGTALGGGLEVALAAHHRVALPLAKCGLPEVVLGLLPGAGGTQRLPRVIGVALALDLVTSGAHVPASEAAAMGLIDAVIEGDLRSGAIAYAERVIDDARPLVRVRDRDDLLREARANPVMFDTFRAANADRFRGLLAPEYNIQCIEAAVLLPFEDGMAREAILFRKLVADPQSAAQRHIFFAERQAAKVSDIGPDVIPLPIAHVGVVGGAGDIAGFFRGAGITVTTTEPDALAELADCDLVIGTGIDGALFTALDSIAEADAILATTSPDLDEVAAGTLRPGRVIGLNFLTPKALEIIRGRESLKPVVAAAVRLAKTMGYIGVTVRGPASVAHRMRGAHDRHVQKLISAGVDPADITRILFDFGFPEKPAKQGSEPLVIGENALRARLLYAIVNEAAHILGEGLVERASDIDILWVAGLGWPRYRGGPLFWADLEGLPRILAALQSLAADHGEDFQPAPLIEQLVAEGKRFT